MKKNNLEILYQKKLKDFREIPDEKVWDAISASLDKKKKKWVVPIWWKLGGVAAMLALLLYITKPFEENTSINQTTGIEKPTKKNLNDNQKISKHPNAKVENKVHVTEASKNKGEVVNNEDRFKATDSSNKPAERSIDSKTKELTSNKDEKGRKEPINRFRTEILLATNQKEKLTANKELGIKDTLKNSETIELTASSLEKNIKNSGSNLIEDFNKKDALVTTDKEVKGGNKSILEAIEAQKEEVPSVKNKNKWSVGPSIAPVYFDAIGQGSSIDAEFVQNSKSGNVNLSYGLAVAYELGKRLKLRSGIHKVDYGYNTNEIIFSSALNASSGRSLDNIDFSQASSNIIVESNNNNRTVLKEGNVSDFTSRNQIRDGRLAQQLGYLEVPVELNYALVDKKFGVNLIGGVSSLFLVDNTVALESGDLVTELGEANNINTVNFSTNVGVGFSYEFSPKVQLNIEPIFKYQLNTFSETSGSFNPYSVGVYSGVRFNF